MIEDLRSSDPISVGPYRLLGRLGVGGMGQVYLARSPGGRQVAIKVIRPELVGEHEFRARFAREVAAARNVSGMFTAAVVDADPDGPEPWMATAYVQGPSLAEAVSEEGALPEETVLALAAGLAEGLHAIHRAGLVHRDLKPSNVLLAGDGPRVIDFGISRAGEGSMLTQAQTVMGTAGYMSPEQARGLVVGPVSDVFSLGAVLTFAATGTGPFGAGPTDALLYRVVHEPPELSVVPDGLRQLIEWCLAKEPDSRPTADQLLGELGPRVGAITDSWLPELISVTLSRYVRTTPNPVLPSAQAATDHAPAEITQEPAAEDVSESLAPAAATGGVAVDGLADVDTHDVLIPGPAPAPAPVSVAEADAGGGPGPGGPVIVPLRTSGGRRRLLAAGGAAVVVVLGTVTALVLELSPASPSKVTGGPTPAVIAATSPRATHPSTHAAAPKPTKKPTPHPTHTTAKHHRAPPKASPSVTTPSAAQTTPQQAQTSPAAPPTTPAPQKTTPAPKRTTPPPSGPQTVSSSGATPISCSQYGSVGSAAGGSAVSYSFVNRSSADVQIWYLTSGGTGQPDDTLAPGDSFGPSVATGQDWMVANAGGGCIGIFGITGSGEAVAS